MSLNKENQAIFNSVREKLKTCCDPIGLLSNLTKVFVPDDVAALEHQFYANGRNYGMMKLLDLYERKARDLEPLKQAVRRCHKNLEEFKELFASSTTDQQSQSTVELFDISDKFQAIEQRVASIASEFRTQVREVQDRMFALQSRFTQLEKSSFDLKQELTNKNREFDQRLRNDEHDFRGKTEGISLTITLSPVDKISEMDVQCLDNKTKTKLSEMTEAGAGGAIYFKNVFQGEKSDVDKQLCAQKLSQEEEKRSLMTSIVDTALFFGRQGLPFPGRPENLDSDDTRNKGNLLELLQLLAVYNPKLKSHLDNLSSPNAIYLSEHSQNELIDIIGRKLQEIILNEVKEAEYFAVLADETTDISGKEQMGILLRFLKENEICERLVAFVQMPQTTGESLGSTIESQLIQFGLDLNKLRGQGYDGASNMSDHIHGCQAYLLEKYPLAVYTHCYSHNLNLVIVQTCDDASIRNILGTVQSIAALIRDSAKRLEVFDKNLPLDAKARRLKLLCQWDERWDERADALTVFCELIEPISATLTSISQKRSHNSCTANAFLKAMSTFEFLITITCVEKLLGFSLPVAHQLEERSIDLLKAADLAKEALESVRLWQTDADARFCNIFKQVVALANKLDIPISKPTVGRQGNQANPPDLKSIEDYFRVAVFIPMCDHFIQEMTKRFSTETKTAFLASLLIPSQIGGCRDLKIQEKIKPLITMYKADFPFPSPLDSEITKWQRMELGERPYTVKRALEHCEKERFPNIRRLLCLLALLPVTKCENERSLSALKRLKIYLTSTMSQDRMVGLALINVHRDMLMQIDNKSIVDEYCKQK